MYSVSFLAMTRWLHSTPGTSLHWQTWTLVGRRRMACLAFHSERASQLRCELSILLEHLSLLCVPLLNQTVSTHTVVIPHFAEEKELWLRDIKKPAKEQKEN